MKNKGLKSRSTIALVLLLALSAFGPCYAAEATAGGSANSTRIAATSVATEVAGKTSGTNKSEKVLVGNAKIYHDLMTRYGAAYVRVKYVMSMSYMGSDNRQEIETSAVLIGKDGLILVSDAMINPKSMMAASMPQGMEFPDVKSDEFRVRMGDSDEDLAAEMVTHDSDLGLAWLKLKSPPKNLVWVDLSKQSTLDIGQVYYGLSRTSADLGSVVIGSHGTIVGKTDTPVRSMLATGPLDLAFAPDGNVVGFVALRLNKDMMMGVRGGANPQNMIYADKLWNATEMARKTVIKTASEGSN